MAVNQMNNVKVEFVFPWHVMKIEPTIILDQQIRIRRLGNPHCATKLYRTSLAQSARKLNASRIQQSTNYVLRRRQPWLARLKEKEREREPCRSVEAYQSVISHAGREHNRGFIKGLFSKGIRALHH